MIGPPMEPSHSFETAMGRGVSVALLNQSLAFSLAPFQNQRGVAVKLLGAGLGDVVHLRARLTSILAGIAVENDRGLLNLVRAERQVAGAGVIQVQVRVHVVVAIDGEQVGDARQVRKPRSCRIRRRCSR